MTVNQYVAISLKKTPYKKLVKLVSREGRTISKMLEILVDDYSKSKVD